MRLLPLFAATLLASAVPVLFCEGGAFARTTGPSLSDEVRAGAATESAPGSELVPARALSSWLNVNGIRMCHIPKHPKDGVPASIHPCPLAFASTD